MYCWNCGTNLPERALYCMTCGKSQAADAPDMSATPVSSPPTPVGSTQRVPPPIPATAVPDWQTTWASSHQVQPEPPSRVAGFLTIGAALLVVIGSWGPWVTVSVFLGTLSVNGSQGDGRFTVWIGAIASGLMVRHVLMGHRSAGWAFASAALLLLAGIIGVADWANISGVLAEAGEDDQLGIGALTQVGWGLQLMTTAGLGGAILATVQGFTSRNR